MSYVCIIYSFTHLRSAPVARDPVADVRPARYNDHEASIRSRRVQMQMEQRPGVRAALARARVSDTTSTHVISFCSQ